MKIRYGFSWKNFCIGVTGNERLLILCFLFWSVAFVKKEKERDEIKELIDEFFDIYESDGVVFWVEYDAENGAKKIYKRFQDWKEKANAIRKRGEK